MTEALKYSVSRLIGFCYGHRLLDYSGKCRNLHGHNGMIEITLSRSKLNTLGMVMDFEDIKSTVQRWVDAELDHKLILCERDPMLEDIRKHGQPVVTLKDNPTAENIARLIFDHAKTQKLPVTSVKLWETPNSYAACGD